METRAQSFEDLRVWRKAIAVAKGIYVLTGAGPLGRDFGLRDQIRRASVSISANIAEGFERPSRREYIYFVGVAKASAGELRSLLRIAFEVGYLDELTCRQQAAAATELSRLLYRLINSLKEPAE